MDSGSKKMKPFSILTRLPVIPIITVKGADEAVAVANDSEYGLSAVRKENSWKIPVPFSKQTRIFSRISVFLLSTRKISALGPSGIPISVPAISFHCTGRICSNGPLRAKFFSYPPSNPVFPWKPGSQQAPPGIRPPSFSAGPSGTPMDKSSR